MISFALGGEIDMRTKQGMTGWFDPALLIQTGIRAAISTVFGHFADKREAIAAANAISATPADAEFDYDKRHQGGDFWLDYLADTGDGWHSTFAMARLVSEDELSPAGEALPRGRLLVLGGDQVYPTATIEDYDNRFRYPFEEAYAPGGVPRWKEGGPDAPDLYAIPGNHDWYDGLSSFFGLFCRRRIASPGDLGISRRGAIIAGRETRQTRSYFAIKLPGNWWMWGTDSQLEGYIDQPQIDYFQHAATHWMDEGSKLILCVADPAWAYVDPKDPMKKFSSFSYLERLAGLARDPSGDRRMGHQIKLVLTGDSHHYAHYVETDGDGTEPARHYVVCGGGGAFLHPTHHLEKGVAFDSRYPRPGVEGKSGAYPRDFRIAQKAEGGEALFPDRKSSAGLGWRNLAFPFLNKSFVGLLFGAYLLFNWILDFTARTTTGHTLVEMLRQADCQVALKAYVLLILSSPWPVLMMLLALAGYYYFADSPTRPMRRALMGILHAAAQTVAVTFATIALVCLFEGWFPARFDAVVSVVLATAGAALVSGFVFGLYLLISLNGLGRHANEGFSSLRIEGWKSFLRLRIGAGGALTVYPVGVKDVPHDGSLAEARLIEQPYTIS
jgi:hypothetical protein